MLIPVAYNLGFPFPYESEESDGRGAALLLPLYAAGQSVDHKRMKFQNALVPMENAAHAVVYLQNVLQNALS